ncbi:MAG: sensor histidine kinase [Massiliimalia sp.]
MKLHTRSIHQKISLTFILFFTVLMVCVIGGFQFLYRNMTQRQLIQNRNYEDDLIVDQLQTIIQNTNNCSNSIIVELGNTLPQSERTGKYPDIYNSVTKQKILNIMDNNLLLFPHINQISVLYDNGDLYRKNRRRDYLQSEGNQELIEAFSKMDINTLGQWYYSLEMKSPLSQFGLHYVKVLRDIQTNEKIGYVILEIDEQKLYSLYRNENTAEEVQFFLTDSNGMIISSDDRLLQERLKQKSNYDQQLALSTFSLENQVFSKMNDDQYYTQALTIPGGWVLYSVMDLKSALSGINRITFNIILIGLVVLAVFFVLIIYISKRITGPLTALSEHMIDTKDRLPEEFPQPEQKDEIGVLISSFNHMVQENKSLFEQVRQEKRAKRHLELSLLQAQIKPHFLYNTLDTIFCLNGMNRTAQANRVIKSLAGYYRLVLNKGSEWVELRQELDALSKYLDIQSVRYADILNYKISVPEEMLSLKIPKLTLQPLTENALYHGIKPKGEPGHILICGETDGEWVYLQVIDDGVGMSPQTFLDILSGKTLQTDGEGFGLKNVSDRIQLFYGEGSCIKLEPLPIGTSIVLCLNLKSKEAT